jgi:hypothetical protein
MILQRGRRFAALCAELYLLTLEDLEGSGPARGWRWEQLIAERLIDKGYPARAIPGGGSIFGVLPASGLRHQIDAEITCTDALVIGEWKAHRGPVPKNDVLRFKAISDDIFDGMAGRPPRLPILRLFGVAGDASPELRWYAARHGIILVERTRWPAPVVADPWLQWPADAEPTRVELERTRWLSRSLQEAYPQADGGGYIVPPLPSSSALDAVLRTHDRLSQRLWAAIDREGEVSGLGGAA